MTILSAIVLLTRLAAGAAHEATLAPGAVHDYELPLDRGASAVVVVHQRGVDVVVEVRNPAGTLIESVDGPTGRNGDEQVEIIASQRGKYAIRVRPFDANEPAGKYAIEVTALRDARSTAQMLAARAASRSRATEWLRAHSGTIEPLARRARVVGIGEATHGSRELADLRFALTRELIETFGYRVVAIEASATRVAASLPWNIWIGRRMQIELFDWVRAWNAAHPQDTVRIVGVDAQDNGEARAALRQFVRDAYAGTPLVARWDAAEKELAAADEQTLVFGDSGVDAATRQFLVGLLGTLNLDAPMLRARFGAARVGAAQEAARTLAQFAEYNSGGTSRDFFMAANVLRALEASPRVVFWAHNAHVAAPPGSNRTAGALLRAALGCEYAALAVTFGDGSFVAQIPNDADDRLAVSTLPAAADESIEAALAPLGKTVVTWPCNVDSAPDFLKSRRAMHWVGALFTPSSLPSAATRAFDIVHDFDGIAYIPHVTAEDVPKDRPHIAPRVR